jgi:hypothetical protein
MGMFWRFVRNTLQALAFWRPRVRRLDVPRFGNHTDRPPPMHWCPCHESTLARFKASFTCPNGHTLTLRTHAVYHDGAVSPSVVCPDSGCRFHAYIRLLNWDFGPIE